MPRKMVTIEDLPANWREILKKLGEEGKTLEHAAKALDISMSLFFNLEKRDEDFREAGENFRRDAYCYWTDLGQDLSTGENTDGSTNAWKYNIQNRHNWSDRIQEERNTTIKADESATELFSDLVRSLKSDD